MSARNTTPYGVKSLVECLARAAIFAKPDDIPECLSRHVHKMTQHRDESRDIKKIAFGHQEQWEKSFFQEEYKRIITPKPSAEESPSPSSSVSSASLASFVAPPPLHEVAPKTQRMSSVMVPRRQESVGRTAEKKPISVPPLPAPGRRVKTRQVSSVRVPCQTDTKLSFPSTLPVLPPIKQKAPPSVSKQEQGHRSTKGSGSGVYTCRLIDCPFHKKPKKGSAAHRELGPVKTSKVPTVKGDLELQKALAEVHVPYTPKGGPILDPELMPKRTKRGLGRSRTTSAERTLLHAGQGSGFSKPGTNSTDLSQVSLETATHTCPHVAHTVHTIRYRRMRVQCSDL
ncbi:uncharacterized protein LOC131992692 [Centropristis striata]|uniref:uncharacterized protein LOC131992692 n=1 Tax=Centropristis striata TaxID=184440 RepID=UPI0027E01CB9|nr:uncharacterized protein LOC131992692 [Centropristis striata]